MLVTFNALNLYTTVELDSLYAITDEHAYVSNKLEADVPKDGIAELLDLPISVVNACIYGDWEDEE
jgi:hypothetical protein